jgi:hypothetical protein
VPTHARAPGQAPPRPTPRAQPRRRHTPSSARFRPLPALRSQRHAHRSDRRRRRGARSAASPVPTSSLTLLKAHQPEKWPPPHRFTGSPPSACHALNRSPVPNATCVPVCPSFADHPNDTEGRGRVVSDNEQRERRGKDRRNPQRPSRTRPADPTPATTASQFSSNACRMTGRTR